jgi:hypothetical protein
MKKRIVLAATIISAIIFSTQGKDEAITGKYSPGFLQQKEFYALSSEKFRTKFNRLVALMKRNDPNPATHMGKPYKNAYFSTFLNDAKRNTMVPTRYRAVTQVLEKGDQGYADLLLEKKPIVEKFLDDLFSPETLTMIAYMQNRYGGGNPSKYDSVLFSQDLDKYAAKGYGKENPTQSAINPTIFGLDSTSYGFLNNLFNAFDSVKKKAADMEPVVTLARRLDANLDKAIAAQQPQGSFDSTMNNLRTLIQNGNPQIMQELVDIEKKYQR